MTRSGWAVLACGMLIACSEGAAPSAPESAPGAPSPTASGEPRVESESTAVETTAGGAPRADRCGTSDGVSEVTVWEVFGGDVGRDMYATFVSEFNADHPMLQIRSVNVAGGSEALLDRLAETDRGEWPDIVVAQPQALRRLVATDLVVPPGECGEIDGVSGELVPAVRAAYSYQGELQAVPFGVSTPILLFDAAEFRLAGLDPYHPPRTLDELSAASRQAVSSGASPNGLVVYDWYGNFLINQGAAQRGDLVATPANGREPGAMSVDYATAANVESMQWLLDMLDNNGGIYIGQVPSGLEDLVQIVDEEDGGVMSIHTSGSLGDLIKFLEAGSFPGVDLGVGPMPGPAPGGLVGGNGLWLIDHDDPARVGAAYEVARWLAAPEQLGRLVAATGYIPPSSAVAEQPAVVKAWAKYPQLRVGFDQVNALDDSPASAGAVFGPSVEIDYVFYAFTGRIVEERVPPQQALADLSDEINLLLEQYDAVTG